MDFNNEISWDGILQALATIIAVILAWYIQRLIRNKHDKRENKEMASILEIVITKSIHNQFTLEKMYKRLLSLDNSKLESLGLDLIKNRSELEQIYPIHEFQEVKLPVLSCFADPSNPCLIAYPNFLNWTSETNIYSLPGSRSQLGGTLMQLFPLSDKGKRKDLWKKIKELGKIYNINLDPKPSFNEWKAKNKLRSRAKETYFTIINIIRSIFDEILLDKPHWSNKLTYYFDLLLEKSEVIQRGFNDYYLLTEIGIIKLYIQIYRERNNRNPFDHHRFQNSSLCILHYEISPNCFINNNNLLFLAKIIREEQNLDIHHQLNNIDQIIIHNLSCFEPSKEYFQRIMNKWIKNVGYCRVPRRYKKILPLRVKMLDKLLKIKKFVNEQIDFFIKYHKIKYLRQEKVLERFRNSISS